MPATSAGWEKRRPRTAALYIKSKICKVGTCWIWKGAAKGRTGSFSYRNNNGNAPRKVYEVLVGKIPEGLCILHSCDDPRCVNPKHLRPGTKKENRADFMKRNPKAKRIIAKAMKFGAAGLKRFWSRMTNSERAEFCKKRARRQRMLRQARR